VSRWVSAAELLALGCPALPSSERGLGKLIERCGWRRDPSRARLMPGQGRGGGRWEYHLSLLPPETQSRLLACDAAGLSADGEATARRTELWSRFESLPEKSKARARARLQVMERIAELRAGGMEASTAVGLAAGRGKVSTSTLWNWLRLVDGVARADWLPALAPRDSGRTATADCDPRAWELIKADYLRPEQPSFAACYRRLVEAAEAQGWSPVPAEKTLRRRLEKEIPAGAQALARGGREAAARAYPHQTRDRSVFCAMQAVNADGHRFDVFTQWPDGTVSRPVMVAIQDLLSGMIVGHRIDRTENWSAVRSCFADMIESFGIPEHAWLDNGRAFAAKWLTGGMANRYRFKVRDDEPAGLLTQLGVTVHWTTPYHGQAKPIERAFLDLCEEIAKHPVCAGAYTGNRPDAKPENYGSTAVPIDVFGDLVAREIVRHNLRPGRRSAIARGRSFAEIYRASINSGAMVTQATAAQRRMFLMAAEGITARKPTGEVHLAGNRYWAEPLVGHMGRRLVVRFDPHDLLAPVAVYTPDGRFVAEAPCVEASGFDDLEAARDHAKRRRDWLRLQRECLAVERQMKIEDVARMLPTWPDDGPVPARPKVVRLAAEAGVQSAGVSDERAAASFGRAVRALAEPDGQIVPFEKKGTGG